MSIGKMNMYTLFRIDSVPETENLASHPLIFVHGTGHGAWCWNEHFISYFTQRGYRTTAFDLRGHGQSEGREHLQSFRLSDYVEDTQSIIEAVHKETGFLPILIGHSLGGAIIENILETQPESIAGAVLLSPIPRGEGWKQSSIVSLKTFGLIRLIRILIAHKSELMYENAHIAQRAFFDPATPDDVVQSYWKRLQPESWMNGDTNRLGNTSPAYHGNVPLLFIGAEHDRVFPPSAIQATAHYYKPSDYKTASGVAHEMMLDSNWQEVADIIATWLKRI
jgi:pimeloyl-ACP methyl ester carboxylesterase